MNNPSPMAKHSSFPANLPDPATFEVGSGHSLFERAQLAVRLLDFGSLAAMLEQTPALGLMRKGGETLLISACGSDCVPLAQTLLPFSDISAACNLGNTALSRAAWQGQGAMAAFLVENGAPLTWPCDRGQDALMVAARSEWHPDCVECARAIAPRADGSRLDSEGRSAFEMAVEAGRHEIGLIIWESQPQSVRVKMARRWLTSLLSQSLGRNGRFTAAAGNDEGAAWPLLDGLGSLLPEAFDEIIEKTQARPQDLPRLFALREALALRSEIQSAPALAGAPAGDFPAPAKRAARAL